MRLTSSAQAATLLRGEKASDDELGAMGLP
jgi:hypothetical protein